jgi:hypothetical protein
LCSKRAQIQHPNYTSRLSLSLMFYSTNCAPKLILVNSPIDDSVL